MATESSTESVNGSTEETSGQGVSNTGTNEGAPPNEESNEQPQEPGTSSSQEPVTLPDDHPLVTAYARQKEELKQLREAGSKTTELENKISGLQEKADAAEGIQNRLDRLEEFLTAVGGPMSRALDSRSFTQALFESDKDIKDIVSDWNKDNPSATSQALGSSGTASKSKTDFNDLLRAAVK